jgi:phospholipid/cholesterol/gamma-HCH transport system permease protein
METVPASAPSWRPDPQTPQIIRLSGHWRVQALAAPGVLERLERQSRELPRDCRWDLSAVDTLDHIGAQWLWQRWGKRRPPGVQLAPGQEEIFRRLEQAGSLAIPDVAMRPRLCKRIRQASENLISHGSDALALLGQLTLDLGRFLLRPQHGPWQEISASIFHIGYQALGITALVGFLIGVVLSYLSAQQLQLFGADIYLVDILGMAIIRELGPLLAAILVAGRSGSSITAQLGVMRVTQELDAMLVMGMPHGFRLILPRVIALAIAMPLLVVWTDAVALAGGIAAAQLELNLSPTYFVQQLPSAVPFPNYTIGVGKGVVFGILIALVACHFGMRVRPDTESLGEGTTLSVVTAITVVILADAVFAVLFQNMGFD